MSYLNNPPNITETFIIESTELTPTITACTGVYTNELISCDSDTNISLTLDDILINKSLLPKIDATIDAGTPTFRFREINSVISNLNTINATGGTITTLNTTTLNLGNLATYNGLSDVSNKFLSGTTNGFVLSSISAITGIDTYVTGFTYSPITNTITLKQNQNQPNKTLTISTVSGLTVSNLNPNYLVYTTSGGTLVTNTSASFDGIDMVLPSSGSLEVGTGGLTVGSNGIGDLIVNGSLTVFGPSILAFTSNLYVEDNNINLNYNPTGNTIATSIGAGWTIQDGNGINGGDVTLDIRSMDTFTGLTSTEIPTIIEYIGSTGYSNRAWVTQLNDIVIRSTNSETPNGVRVLAEFDILDGGFF